MSVIASQSSPSGGAPLGEAALATAVGMVLTALMAIPLAGHVSGRGRLLAALAGASSKLSRLPGWAALPGDILGGALIVAAFGMYWDISLHIDNGRDAGPLANPAHYFILVGLFGVFFAGMASIVLARHERTATSVRLPNGWHAPLGGLAIAFFGALALVAFPLDDTWHRLFGQDVTLWGPTHLVLVGAAACATLGLWVLLTEGRRARPLEPGDRSGALWSRLGELVVPGSLLVGLSTFQAEYDFGVPQFRLVLAPVLIVLAAGIALVAARVRSGPGGALAAVGLYLAVRGALAALVGPGLGQTTTQFPLYLAEAASVELVALAAGTRRTLRFGALAGLAIGTVGLAAEWGWSHVWSPIEWPASMLGEAVLLAVPTAVAAGVLGALAGAALIRERPSLPGGGRTAAALAGAAVLAVLAWGLWMPAPADPPAAAVTLHEQPGAPGARTVHADVVLRPRDAAGGAAVLNMHSYQGGGLVLARLHRGGDGTYRTNRPVPVGGGWKTVVQLERDRAVLALPVYLPRDTAIPAPEVPAAPSFTREFAPGSEVFLREKRDDVPAGLAAAGYAGVAALWAAMVAALVAALARLVRGAPRGGAKLDRSREPLHRSV
ncbi:MAG TPA: hypothetical protein VF715_08835 [Thermoleophilaceae bacterium]